MNAMLGDLRYALRRLIRTPVFAGVAILSLALGIGANTAIFSIVNAVLLKRQPFTSPNELLEVYTSESDGYPYSTSSYPDFQAVRGETGVFAGVVGTRTFLARFERGGRPELAFGELVSGDYFTTLGIPMALGRSFLPEEDATPGTHPVVILSHRTWANEYGADPEVLGTTVLLNGYAFTVVGVVSDRFTGTMPVLATGFFAPLMMSDELMGTLLESTLERRGSRSMFIKARLRDGVSLEQANGVLSALSEGLSEAYPETNEARVISAIPSGDVAIHPLVDRALVPAAALLLAVVGLVLLIACANLASFLLARAEDRRKEIALRLALGARRGQLVRQLMVETLLLAALGGVAGTFLAQWTLDLILGLQPPIPIPVDFVVVLDGNVLAFTAVVSLVAAVAFGLAPALQATRPDIAPTLKDEAAGTGKPGRFSLRGALVVTQVAFSFLLLIGAGLFIRSLQKAQAVDPGFYTGAAAMVWPIPALSGYETPEESAVLMRQLEERLLAHPLIDRVAGADRLPLGAGIQTRTYVVPGMPSETPDGGWDVDNTTVRPGYFEAMEVPILRGRGFTQEDVGAQPVIVVSQAFAARFFPGTDVVGRSVSTPGGTEIRIVGMARDTRVRTLGEDPRPYVYELYRPEMGLGMQFVAIGEAPEADLLAAAREAMDAVDPDLVVFEAKTMSEHLALMLFPPRMAAFMLGIFGTLALVLSAIGIYGVVSYSVARRTREMGIRLSLGATGRDVVALSVGGGMRLVLVGGAVGVVLAGGLTGLISGYLYGISSTDAVTFAAIPVLLTGVALLAAFVPARRAARVDPVRALRAE